MQDEKISYFRIRCRYNSIPLQSTQSLILGVTFTVSPSAFDFHESGLSLESMFLQPLLSVSSICVIWVLTSFTFYFRKKITESSVIFLQNGLNEKRTRRLVQSILRFQRKRIQNYYGKFHQKIMELFYYMEKNKIIFWFVNNSEYYYWEMGYNIPPKRKERFSKRVSNQMWHLTCHPGARNL